MISFRSMTEKEFPAFLEYFISDYADEIQSNYRLSPADSLVRATKEISETLAGELILMGKYYCVLLKI